MEKTYEVKGMSCVICKANVENTLNSLNGVSSAIVSLMDNEVLIDFDENIVNEQIFKKELAKQDYELVLNKNNRLDKNQFFLILSILLTIILMGVSMSTMHKPHQSGTFQLLLSIIIIALQFHFYKSGFRALLHLKPNMNSLVSLSSFVSYLYSIFALYQISQGKSYHLYFETSAMVLVIVSIGKTIEEKNKKKTTKFIRGLSTLIPMQANLLIDEKIIVTPIEKIKKNDILLVKPGESIPQDGIVISGSSNVDESAITGESSLSHKEIESEVIGGTINTDGKLLIKVNKNATQTTLSKIVSLTKQATMNKVPIEHFSDRISSYFTFVVLSISLLTFFIWIFSSKDIELSLNFALSVLVISCPCALGLATPSAIAVACNTSSKNGVLIKNPAILEIAYDLKTILFDKTGTLTQNKLQILQEIKLSDEFEQVLYSLEKNSTHPIAKAIIEKYQTMPIDFDQDTFISGEGIEAKKGNDIFFAGNEILFQKHNLNLSTYKEYAIQHSCSYIGVGKNNNLLGVLYLKDNLKQGAKKAIEELQNRGIRIMMATGDNEIAASKIAQELNIKEYFSNFKPADKKQIVEKYKQNNEKVAMVGDGINDAVALSSSDVAITLQDGTDIANASSDVSLLTNNIEDILFLMDLSKKTMHIIKQNLFWALFYNAIFIPIAAGAFYKTKGFSLNPMIGSFTMSLSSFIVISNALRIKNIKKKEGK